MLDIKQIVFFCTQWYLIDLQKSWETHRCVQIKQSTLETMGKRRSQNTLKQLWEHSRVK